jgi:sarcosine oxidase subunit gamma
MILRENASMADLTPGTALGRTPPAGASTAGAHCACEFTPFVGVAKIQIFGPVGENLLRDVLGLALPGASREVEAGDISCAWLGPCEWLLTGSEPVVADLVRRLAIVLGEDGLAVDLTHARAVYVLHGPGARDVLATLCPLDLSDAAAGIGFATRSLLADTGLFLARKADEGGAPVFVLIVDQTMASYAAGMLAAPIVMRGVSP